uniref:transglycosylase SLT domain-containing protein n=1 Tax=Stappia sp. TaxID=1870903 RepID=UPI003BAC41B3
MANRQSRDPGRYREFSESARLGGVPDFAVDTGGGARALAQVAGSLSSRLGKLADQAAAREKAAYGKSYAARAGDGYLQARAAETLPGDDTRRPPSRAQVNAPAEIRNAISEAARRHGVDPNAMLRIAELESSFNPQARNKASSAGGLFQFIDATAAQYGLTDRFDPVQASDAAARLARDNAATLREALGREPTAAELYLAHQQGGGGAAKLLANPNARAVDVLGRDQVLNNGGNETMLARDFAGKWLAKAGGGPVRTQSGLPQLSGEPLQLRRDGTIAGEAFDDAARKAYAWRVEQGLSTDIVNAMDEHGDSPAALAGRLREIHDHYLQDEAFQDPQLREVFEKSFAARSRAVSLQAAAKQEQRLKAESAAAASDGLDARTVEIERQAYALGANPEGDTILSDQLGRALGAVDAAVADGLLTPAAGAARKERLAETASRARVQGVFDQLPTPGEKEQFALSLLEDWQSGEGPVAKMPFATVKALSQTLYRDARAQGNAEAAQSRAEKARIQSLLRDDVASIEATGKPLDLEGAGTDLASVAAALTPAEFQAWTAKREAAGALFDAVSGMDTLPADDIEARLSGLAPRPGQPGYAGQEAAFEAAAKRAREIARQRERDPAMAVQNAFPDLARAAAEATPDDPETLRSLVDARMLAQDAIGLPELARQPLTVSEATDLARSVTQGGPADQARAMQDLVGQVQAIYGPHADHVLRQVLEVRGIDKQMAQYGAALFARMARQEAPDAADRRAGAVLQETASAEQSGSRPDVYPIAPYRAQAMLVERPELAAQFDEKYGPGAAARILGQRREDPYRRRVEGGVEFVDETGEGFIPDE